MALDPRIVALQRDLDALANELTQVTNELRQVAHPQLDSSLKKLRTVVTTTQRQVALVLQPDYKPPVA